MRRKNVQMRIRLPEEMKSFVQTRAKENRRSMNSEIIFRLEESRKREMHESQT